MISTNDKTIRKAFKSILHDDLKKYRLKNKQPARIFEELGVKHGTARIDIAVINGVMHGYEIKSDLDTLRRLPEQMNEYNAVFDQLTLIVGKHHLYDAINIIPDWWGIIVARVNSNGKVIFHNIRVAENNPVQVKISIARLLWRDEALRILEERNRARGVRSKPRETIYRRLAEVLEMDVLKAKVRETLLISRKDWRFGVSPMLSGG